MNMKYNPAMRPHRRENYLRSELIRTMQVLLRDLNEPLPPSN
jgi:hypothetical protein